MSVSLSSGVPKEVLTTRTQVIEQTRAYVCSQSSFGLHYLEHESLHFTTPTGRVWKVYGSPVSVCSPERDGLC